MDDGYEKTVVPPSGATSLKEGCASRQGSTVEVVGQRAKIFLGIHVVGIGGDCGFVPGYGGLFVVVEEG